MSVPLPIVTWLAFSLSAVSQGKEPVPTKIWKDGTSPVGFPSPLSDAALPCEKGRPSFSVHAVHPPVWCPDKPLPYNERWLVSPETPVHIHPDRSDVAIVNGSFLHEISDRFAAVDQSWRNAMMEGLAPDGTPISVLPGLLTVSDKHWMWTDGQHGAVLQASAEVPLGLFHADNQQCLVVGAHGKLRFKHPCLVPLRARQGSLTLFPVRDPDAVEDQWLIHLDVPLRFDEPPMVVIREAGERPLPWVLWILTLGLMPLAYFLGRRAPLSVDATLPTEPPLTVQREAPLEPAAEPEKTIQDAARVAIRSSPIDPYARQQAWMLDKLPHLRLAAHWAARNPALLSHDGPVQDLLGKTLSAIAHARERQLPGPYVDAWAALAEHAQASQKRVRDLQQGLKLVFDNPRSIQSFSEELLTAWKTTLPHTNEKVKDKGAELASQFRLDLIDLALVPHLRLAQWLYEALPRECPDLAPNLDSADLANLVIHSTEVAELLGYRYEHVPLYAAQDVDYVLDRSVTLIRSDGAEIFGERGRPSLLESGAIFRIKRPLFRALRTDTPSRKAQFLIFRP